MEEVRCRQPYPYLKVKRLSIKIEVGKIILQLQSYKACITYNCKAAEEIFGKEPSLNGYAAINANLEVVEIMVAKHKALLSMPDWEGMMPLCKAALSGRYDVVKYLFDKSDGLRGDGWDAKNRAWLLQKCVGGDMFDIALQILTEHIEIANDEELLRILARKPDTFVKKSSNFHWKTVIWVFAFVCPKEGHPKKDTEALQLLKMKIKDMINRDDRLSNGNQEQQPHPPELIADYAKIEPTISSDIVFIAAEMGNT
ncbi:ankyrin repeat-containing domain, PGG domain protein [Tanacetum coccineum]